MELLPVAAPLHSVHQDVLTGHEGQLLPHVALDHLLMDHQSSGHVGIDAQNGIHRQESLGHGQTLVGRVVQSTLEPLGGGGDRRVDRVGHHIAGQGADALAAHGIALVGHGGGTDLVFLKGLLHLLQVAEQAQIGGELAGRLGNAGEGGQHRIVHLAGIGLTRNGHHGVEAHLGGDLPLQRPAFLMVSLEQLQEGCLSAGGALAAQQLQRGDAVLHLLQIHQQLVHPEGGPLPHRHQLSGLEVGEAQGRQGLVLLRELRQAGQHLYQLVAHQQKGLPHKDHVGVVPHIAARGSQVDDGHSFGARLAIGVDVCHHVVAELLFIRRGFVVVNVGEVGLQLVHLLLGHRQSQLHLGPGQGDPQAAPGGKFLVGRKDILHLVAGVAGGQRALITVVHAKTSFSSDFTG